MAKTYVMADIHGGYLSLKQCLERAGFNKEEDTLIQLGDVVDGWSQTYQVVEELLTIKNLISIKGNHDDWFYQWLLTGVHPINWLHGGMATKTSYMQAVKNIVYERSLNPSEVKQSHIDFFTKQELYYVDDKNRVFVHGGFDRHYSLADTKGACPHVFYWDRDLWAQAMSYETMLAHVKAAHPFKMKEGFSEVFIGHTSTGNWGLDTPMHKANIWNLDTGGGFEGKLTIMDVDTKEYWQSDLVKDLYFDEKGRNVA